MKKPLEYNRAWVRRVRAQGRKITGAIVLDGRILSLSSVKIGGDK